MPEFLKAYSRQNNITYLYEKVTLPSPPHPPSYPLVWIRIFSRVTRLLNLFRYVSWLVSRSGGRVVGHPVTLCFFWQFQVIFTLLLLPECLVNLHHHSPLPTHTRLG